MVYVGDRNAFNKIVGVFDNLKGALQTHEILLKTNIEENQRLKNIIYTTLEYVDREEVSSVGTPFTSTSIGKEIKELLEGEKTFNSIWKENQRLNNILKLKTDFIAELLKIILVSRDYELQDKCEIRAKIYEEKLQELKEIDK